MGYESIPSYWRLYKIKLCCEYDSVLMDEIKEDILNKPDDNEYGYFIECDLEYSAEIKEKTENFPLCPYQTKADRTKQKSCLQRI